MRLFIALFALTSFSAFAACPNLAGQYANCRSTTGESGGSRDLVITQTVKNGVTTYIVTSTDEDSDERTSEEIIADGKARTKTENDPNMGEVKTTTKYSCSGPKVTGSQSISIQGMKIAELNQQIQKKGSVLEIDIFGKVFGEPLSDTLICE